MSELEVSTAIKSYHHRLLSNALDGTSSSSAAERVIYHYTRSLNGFAAMLTEHEKNKLAGMDGVLSIHETVLYKQQTTSHGTSSGCRCKSTGACRSSRTSSSA
ncbi:hypothetical protein ACP4OV_006928 [Aristida adscensionis]